MFDLKSSQVSNRADWIDCVEVIDDESGMPYDLTTVQDIVMAVLHPMAGEAFTGARGGPGYSPANYYGIQATLSGGQIVLVAPGIFQFTFTAAQMSGLAPQVYNLGIVIRASDGVVYQLIIGDVSVLEGFAMGVSAA